MITRSKAQWVEKGERCTKYFFGLERSNAKKKMITKLVDDKSGECLLTQDKITDYAVNYYQNIYSSTYPKAEQISDYIQQSSINSIPDSLSSTLDEQVTLEELETVIKSLKNNKSPGWDGLTAEFYRFFWDDIKFILYNSFQESINSNCLSPSQRIGVITLFLKPKPPPELVYIKNWRPITLLNIDYKIFAHIVKNRFIQAIPLVVSKVQSGFQSGKSSSDNLILMCLVLDHYNNHEDDGGLVLQVDFEKAFDSVEHSFLFKTLETMGFGQYIIKLVKIAFHGCFGYINVNGYLSKPVYLGRGLHQGSPLSPILFLLIAQVFSRKLEINNNINGLKVSGIELLLSLFADDTDLFLEATGDSVDEVVKEMRDFGILSGCKANLSKTKCILLGQARTDVNLTAHITERYGADFLTNDFTALGVHLNNYSSLQDISNLNYSEKFEKAKTKAIFWNSRDLTIYGRITIIKLLLLVQFVYIVTPLPRTDSKITQEITNFTFKFVWGGKVDKVKRNIITQKREKGGLNMLYLHDFICGIKVKLLQKVGNFYFEHNWKDIVINQCRYPDVCRPPGHMLRKWIGQQYTLIYV